MPGQAAATAWRSVRAALAPFTDGSRRPHTDRPTTVTWALRLHEALRRDLGPLPPDTDAWRRRDDSHELAVNLRTTVNHLPAIAGHLDDIVRSWAGTGHVMAQAPDLYRREERTAQLLAGRHPDGLVTADLRDRTPVRRAIQAPELLSTKLGNEVSNVIGAPAPVRDTYLAAASHQRFSDPADEIHSRTTARRVLSRAEGAAHAAGRPPRSR